MPMQLAPRRDLLQDFGFQFGAAAASALPAEVDEPYNGLDLLAGRPRWQSDAACKEHDPKLWFPERGAHPDDVVKAREVCGGCLVQTECKAWALAQGPELEGMWAGLTKGDRNEIRMGRRAA